MYHVNFTEEEYWLTIKALNALKLTENDDITVNSPEVEALIMKLLSHSLKVIK